MNHKAPQLTGKRYYTIVEVIDLCGVNRDALRRWERHFPQLQPVKRPNNRRYYSPQDVILVHRIHDLLYREGLTVEDARKKLAENVPT